MNLVNANTKGLGLEAHRVPPAAVPVPVLVDRGHQRADPDRLLLADAGGDRLFLPGQPRAHLRGSHLLYSLTAYIADYVASSKLLELVSGGQGSNNEDGASRHDWMVSCVLTASLFAGPYLLIFSVVNIIAMPFAFIVTIILLWVFAIFPLTAFSAFRGGKAAMVPYPCHVKKV